MINNTGMEEDENGDWVVRFELAEGKLKPTEATKKLFPKAKVIEYNNIYAILNKYVEKRAGLIK